MKYLVILLALALLPLQPAFAEEEADQEEGLELVADQPQAPACHMIGYSRFGYKYRCNVTGVIYDQKNAQQTCRAECR